MCFNCKRRRVQIKAGFTIVQLQIGFRELEGHFLSSEFLVDAGKCVGLVLDVGLLSFVEVDLEEPGSVQTNPSNRVM